MSRKKATRLPSPLYQKPARVPMTRAELRASLEQLALSPTVLLSTALDDEAAALRGFLTQHGVTITEAAPSTTKPGSVVVSVDGGFACYRAADVHPAVVQAVEALAALQEVRRGRGDSRVLAAIRLGGALERTSATTAWARYLTGIFRNTEGLVGGRKKAAAKARQKGSKTARLVRERYVFYANTYRLPAKEIPARIAQDACVSTKTVLNHLTALRKTDAI